MRSKHVNNRDLNQIFIRTKLVPRFRTHDFRNKFWDLNTINLDDILTKVEGNLNSEVLTVLKTTKRSRVFQLCQTNCCNNFLRGDCTTLIWAVFAELAHLSKNQQRRFEEYWFSSFNTEKTKINAFWDNQMVFLRFNVFYLSFISFKKLQFSFNSNF